MKKFFTVLFLVFLLAESSLAEEKRLLFSLYPQGNKSVPAFIELTEYISEKLKTHFNPVFEPNYSNATRMLANKEVDFAFLCSGPYVIGKERYGIEALVAIKPAFNVDYRAYIVVPFSSSAKTFQDLKGRSFAFVDLQSYTGRLVPLYMIKKMGEKPTNFFSDTIYAKSHEAAFQAVLDGKVAGSSVISLLVEHFFRVDPTLRKKVKIIEKSEKAGFPVFATVRYASDKEKAAFKNVLLNMHKDAKGRKILQKLEIEHFYEPKDSEYDLIRKQFKEVKEFVP